MLCDGRDSAKAESAEAVSAEAELIFETLSHTHAFTRFSYWHFDSLLSFVDSLPRLANLVFSLSPKFEISDKNTENSKTASIRSKSSSLRGFQS